MLVECLKELSEEQLLGMLPSGVACFIGSVTDNEGFRRDKIAQSIAINESCNFVFDDKKRNFLIRSISPVMLLNIFPELADSVSEITPSHYDYIVDWSFNVDNNNELAKRLGVLDEVVSVRKVNEDPKRISLVVPSYGLYPYQKDISDKVLSHFQKNQRILVHLPTGSGKTRTAMNIVVEHLRESKNNLVLWLADREELCQQAFDEFEKAWSSCGDKESKAYGFYSSSNESLSGIDSGFIVAGLHTLNSIRKQDAGKISLLYNKLKDKVTLVIFDEAHKAIAETYQKITEDFINAPGFSAKLIGLTATPGRAFGNNALEEENARLAKFFDNSKVTMDVSGYISPIDYLVSNKYLAKVNFESLSYKNSKISSFALVGNSNYETLKALSLNEERNKLILDVIKSEASKGRQIILFACSVSHAQYIAVTLNCLGIKSASIDSKLDTAISRRFKIKQYKENKIQVLTNFNVLTAGFDAPNTSVSIIAKPTNSLVEYLQMAGRAMRGQKSNGNLECWVYNVNDDIPEFNSISTAFKYWDQSWVV